MRVGRSFDVSRSAWIGVAAREAISLGRLLGRAARCAVPATALVVCPACSSSSTSVTSPSAVRCPVDLALSPTTLDAAGGSGQITIAVGRECTWDARSETEWIALMAPTSGQGEAILGYTASPNAVVSARRGAVVVNDQRVEIAQAAAACRFDLSARGASVAAQGGRITVSVTAQPSCVWTAVSQVDWVRIDAGREGDGQGVVTMSVAASTGAAREGTVLIAGQRYSVSQSAAPPPGPPPPPPAPTPPPPPPPPTPPGCEFTVSPRAESFAPGGGDGTVRVVASASNCAWTAVSNAAWISVAGGGGTGNGNVRYTVAPNAGGARTGTMSVAGATVTVSQEAAPPPGSIRLEGEISNLTGQCPNLRFTLDGRQVRTNGATVFDDVRCDRLRNGRDATVWGVVQGDGSVTALRVREDDD
jgi:hypothetical protein